MPRSVLSIVACALLAGCSTLINPDTDLLGDAPDASAAPDAGAADAGEPPPGDDAGPPPPPDAGPVACEPFEPECRGDAVIACADGFETSRDCQAEGAYCREGGCRPWVCTPGSRVCTPGLGSVLACDARGTGSMEIACTGGACDPATGMCGGVEPGACDDLPTIDVGGNERVDLCERDDDYTFRAGGDCDPRFQPEAGDQMFALTIERAGNYRIELEDEAILEDIDTVLYLRRQCDEPRSQTSCSDDTRCEPSMFPFGGDCEDGVNTGLSRLEGFLDVGTYYLVADAFVYDMGERGSSECGTVELRVREAD